MRFRVHFEDGSSPDIEADHADEAREIAMKRMIAERGHAVRISKVKVVKEKVDE